MTAPIDSKEGAVGEKREVLHTSHPFRECLEGETTKGE